MALSYTACYTRFDKFHKSHACAYGTQSLNVAHTSYAQEVRGHWARGQNLESDWTRVPLVMLRQTNQICCCLLTQQVG